MIMDFSNKYKNNRKNDSNYSRKKRTEMTVSLRKEKRKQAFRSKRMLTQDDVIDEKSLSITSTDDLVTSLSSSEPETILGSLSYLLGKDEVTVQIMMNVDVLNVIVLNIENEASPSIQVMLSKTLIHVNKLSAVQYAMGHQVETACQGNNAPGRATDHCTAPCPRCVRSPDYSPESPDYVPHNPEDPEYDPEGPDYVPDNGKDLSEGSLDSAGHLMRDLDYSPGSPDSAW